MTLRNVLALDSLYNFLNQYERWLCHRAILTRTKNIEHLTKQIQKACEIIEKHKYEAPMFRYSQDRILLYYDEEYAEWFDTKIYKPTIRDIIFRELKQPK